MGGGGLGDALSPKSKIFYVKVDRGYGTRSEQIQRQCIAEVSRKRIARGGAPVKELGDTEAVRLKDDTGSKMAGIATAGLIGTAGMALLIPFAGKWHAEKEYEEEWVRDEMRACVSRRFASM